MNGIIERIKEAYLLKTDAEVAEFLNLNPSTLSMQKNRGHLNLERIIEKCSDLNKNWLLEGEGPIWKKELNYGSAEIPIYSSLTLLESNKPDFRNSRTEGNILIDVPEDWEDIPSVTDHLIGYMIRGNAMAPLLKKQDIAFFDLKSRTPKDNAIFLMSLNREVVCRRIEENDGNLIITAEDGYEDNLELSESNIEYTIIGKMILMLRTI